MFTRSGPIRVAFASLAATGTTLLFCSAVVLSTTACGIRVSSTDFPVFRLSEPEPVAKPVAQAVPASAQSN
jgi:hypothetical protein